MMHVVEIAGYQVLSCAFLNELMQNQCKFTKYTAWNHRLSIVIHMRLQEISKGSTNSHTGFENVHPCLLISTREI